MNFCQNLKMPKGAKPAPVGTIIQKALRVQITNNLVEGYFLKVTLLAPGLTTIVSRKLARYNIYIAAISETRVLGDNTLEEVTGG